MQAEQLIVKGWARSLYLANKHTAQADGALLLRFRFADDSERLLCLPSQQWAMLLDAVEMYCAANAVEHPMNRRDYKRVFAAWKNQAPEATPLNMKPGREHTARNIYVNPHPNALLLKVEHLAGPPADFLIVAYLAFFLFETIKFAVEEYGLQRPRTSVQ